MKINFVQKLIDKIRNKPDFTNLLADKVYAIKSVENIKTLILGSSHLANGYIANEDEFNFALPSQDLYYAYNIYKKLNQKNIRNIVIAFSVFTPGLSIIRTQCAEFAVNYKLLLDIDYQDKNYATSQGLFDKENEYKKRIEKYNLNIKIPNNYRGNLVWYPKSKFNAKKAQERALKHLKNNQRENSQMNYCLKLLNLAKENNQKVFFILPPATLAYRKALPKKEIIFKDLYELIKGFDNAAILNYYDTDLFDEKKDFSNEDHLNKKGATKLSDLIRGKINE